MNEECLGRKLQFETESMYKAKAELNSSQLKISIEFIPSICHST